MKTKTKTRWPSTMTVSEFQERIAAQVAGRAPLPANRTAYRPLVRTPKHPGYAPPVRKAVAQ